MGKTNRGREKEKERRIKVTNQDSLHPEKATQR